jgi:hypothetical protein
MHEHVAVSSTPVRFAAPAGIGGPGFIWRARVFFDDLDAMGMLHNSRYLVLAERATSAFFEANGWRWEADPRLNPDQFYVVREQRVRYLEPIHGPGEIAVQMWVAHPLAAQARYAIDWSDRFDGPDAYAKRRPKPPATWQELQADIEAIPSQLAGISHVAITGSLRQATAFTVGAALRMVTNIDRAVVQRGTLWTSDAPYRAPIQPAITEIPIGQGSEIAIAVEIATPIAADVREFLIRSHVPVGQLVVLRPPGGARDNAIATPEDAAALAVGIRDAARRAACGNRVHLFLAGPMGLAMLLRHRWNRVGPTTVYEDLAALGYDAAFTVSA